MTSIIVPGGTNKLMSLFSNSNDIVIPWENIKCISDDLIFSRNLKNIKKI